MKHLDSSFTVFELLTRVLCDTRPEHPADAAYLFCTTSGNQVSLNQAARALIDPVITAKILILAAPALSGYSGETHCRNQLLDCGLAPDLIETVPLHETPSLNTLIESQALIAHAKENAFKTTIVVAPPFHQLRAFMTAVTVALRQYPALAIYSFPGTALSWTRETIHSQGLLKAPRRQLIEEEFARIRTYQQKGDLAGFREVLDYLDCREDKT